MQTGTRLRFYKRVGYITPPPREVIFSPEHPQPKRLLFLFPLELERLKASRYVAKRLQRYLDGGDIYLAIPGPYRDLLSFPTDVAFYFPMHPDDPTRINMDVMLARFRNQTFDAIVNLDPEFNFQMARVISVIKTHKRIGFAGSYADELYNIQISPDPDKPLSKAYAQMLKLCDLGARRQSSTQLRMDFRSRS